MTNDNEIIHKKYANADIWAAQIPVVFCPGCQEIRDEHEMIEGKPCCVHCRPENE